MRRVLTHAIPLLTRMQRAAIAAGCLALLVSALPMTPAQAATTHQVTLSCRNGGGTVSQTVLAGDSIQVSSSNCTGWNSAISDSPSGTWTASWTTGPSVVFPATLSVVSSPSLSQFTVRFTGPGPAYQDLAVTVAQPLGAPTSLQGSIGDGQIDLWWTTPSGGTGTLTDYEVQSSTDGGTNWSTAGTVGSGAPPTSQNPFRIAGLQNGTTYTFQVRAKDTSNTWGPYSTASGSLTPSLPPPSPTNVSGTAGNGSVTVSWTAPSMTGYAALTGYKVEQSTDGNIWSTSTSNTGSTGTTYSATSLTNGTGYYFRVSGINAAGTGTASTASTAVIPRTTPGLVTNIAASTPQDDMLSLTWTAPNDNGAAIDGYSVEIAPESIQYMPPNNTPMPGPGTFAAPASGTCTTATSSTNTACTITGLTAGSNYYVRVSAHNAAGYGSTGGSMALTPVGLPAAPTTVLATAGNGQASLSWTAGSNGGSTIAGYKVEKEMGGNWITVSADTQSTSTSYTVTGLTNGSSYTFRVSAITARGTGPASTASAAATPSTTPGQPNAPQATRGDTQVLLSWLAPADGGSAVTGYKVEKEMGGNWTTVSADTQSTSTSYTVTGLTNGTAYTFRVTAINANGAGTASSASASVTPVTLPGTPSNLTATPSNGQVSLAWSPGSGGGSSLTGHSVEASTDGGTSWTTVIADTGSALGSATVTGLTNGTPYLFRVSGISGSGTGLPATLGSAVSPSTTPSAPTSVAATVGDQQVVLTWAAGATGGSAITGYTIERNDGSGWTTVTANTQSTSTSYTATGLTNGTAYTFRVTPLNVNGSGAAAVTSPAVTPIEAPGVPAQPTAIAATGSATVSVTAGTGGAPSSYTVTASPGSAVCTVTGTSGSCTLTGLTAGTAYTFTATATNATGTSQSSVASAPVTPLAPSSGGASGGSPAPGGATSNSPVSVSPAALAPVLLPLTSGASSGAAAGSGVVVPVSAAAMVGGAPATVTTTNVPAPVAGGSSNGVLVQGAGFSSSVSGPPVGGLPAGSSPMLVPGRPLTIVASGFAQGSSVGVYAMPSGVLVATLVAGPNGVVNGNPVLLPAAARGMTSLQIAGPSGDGVGLFVGLTVAAGEPAVPVPDTAGVLPTRGPGGSYVMVDNLPVPTKPTHVGNSLVVEEQGAQLVLRATSDSGAPLPIGESGALRLQDNGSVAVAGEGMVGFVDVFVFSEPIYLGRVLVRPDGTFAGALPLPVSLPTGQHTLQLVGQTPAGRQIAASLGVVKERPVARTKFVRTVAFSAGSSRLSWTARKVIAAFAAKAAAHRPEILTILVPYRTTPAVHTSESRARAEAVATELRRHGGRVRVVVRKSQVTPNHGSARTWMIAMR